MSEPTEPTYDEALAAVLKAARKHGAECGWAHTLRIAVDVLDGRGGSLLCSVCGVPNDWSIGRHGRIAHRNHAARVALREEATSE